MRMDQFDLNLLVAFDALLTERSVTAAAQRMGLTQSAMSAALKRLREALGDDILVQQGKWMIPTPHALMLEPQICSALQTLRGVIASATQFDPKTSDRHFHIVASDYATAVLVSPLLSRLQATAPHLRFEVRLPDPTTLFALNQGKLDLLITPERYVADEHPKELLFTERHVVVGCASNPQLDGPMNLDTFYASGHIAVTIDGKPSFIDSVFSDNKARRVELTAPSFLQAALMVRNTTRLALIHERLARMLRTPLSLAIAECPLPLPTMREMMQFHSARQDDPGLAWLRNELRAEAQGGS